MCDHGGFHTGSSRYDRGAGVLHFVLVCEDCDTELLEVAEQEYRPQPVFPIVGRHEDAPAAVLD